MTGALGCRFVLFVENVSGQTGIYPTKLSQEIYHSEAMPALLGAALVSRISHYTSYAIHEACVQYLNLQLSYIYCANL